MVFLMAPWYLTLSPGSLGFLGFLGSLFKTRPRLEDGNHSPESEKDKSDKPEVGAQGTMRRASKMMIINPLPSGKQPHNYGKSPCSMEKIHYKWSCSIAMLNYQRVSVGISNFRREPRQTFGCLLVIAVLAGFLFDVHPEDPWSMMYRKT